MYKKGKEKMYKTLNYYRVVSSKKRERLKAKKRRSLFDTKEEEEEKKKTNDRQLPQHVRRVRVRVPVPAVFMFQGSIMRSLSCVCVVSWGGLSMCRDLSFNPFDVSPFFPLL